jgi:hypothetical protein
VELLAALRRNASSALDASVRRIIRKASGANVEMSKASPLSANFHTHPSWLPHAEGGRPGAERILT